MIVQVVPGSQFEIEADLVLLAMGFLGPQKHGVVDDSAVELTPQGNVRAEMSAYRTSRQRIFACGDMRRGQSLVVWAIREGRDCAAAVDAFLTAERQPEAALVRSS
jgi:glutamate synthase (NADPH/NADH) small chain